MEESTAELDAGKKGCDGGERCCRCGGRCCGWRLSLSCMQLLELLCRRSGHRVWLRCCWNHHRNFCSFARSLLLSTKWFGIEVAVAEVTG